MDHLRVSFSGVRHQTHMVYVSSWLRRYAAERGATIEVVDLDDLGDERSASRRSSLERFLPAGTTLVPPADVAHDRFDRTVAIGAPAVRRWVRRPLRARTVVVDEGLGSYGTFRTRRSALRREGRPEPQASLVALTRGVARRAMAAERWRLYRHEGGQWAANPHIADEFARHHPVLERGDHVVYVSQPWVELGLVDESAHLGHLERIAAVVESVGRRLVVSPHPWEAADRYAGFDTTTTTGPAELDPTVVGAAAVVGDTSTALLNLAAMFGVPAWRVAPPMAPNAVPPLSAAQRSLFDAFTGPVTSIDALADRLAR